jgi:pyrroline-5-carboxylate reductase
VTTTVLIGGGKMGEALLGGWLCAGTLSAAEVHVVEPDDVRRAAMLAAYPGITAAASVAEVLAAPEAFDAVIAVKPQHVESVCTEIAGRAARVLSIAAGVPIAKLERWLSPSSGGRTAAVVRSMPNTPALVGAGASAIAPGSSATPADTAWAEALLGTVGVVEVVGEASLDAVTGLSGSGPAYVFLIAEAMIEAGVSVGLARATASALAVQTLLGAGRLLAESGDEPAVLRANVTSPGGTTAAGLRVLEQRGVRTAFIDAVHAATARSRELGSA